MSAAPIRVTILTGFLGAGKTTLLNAILRDPDVTRTAVIVNEFGAVSIDHLLVERSDEELIELADGCVCCTVRGALVDTLADLVDRVQTGRLQPLSRVVIETTGLADPTPILASLMAHPVLVEAFALDGVVTVVDADAGIAAIEGRRVAERQVACADRIVVSKGESLEAADLDALVRRLQAMNARAEILVGARGEAAPAAVLRDGLGGARPDLDRWLGKPPAPADSHAKAGHGHVGADHHHGGDHRKHKHEHGGHGHADDRHAGILAVSLQHDRPIGFAALDAFLDLLAAVGGERILRMKAIVDLAERPGHPLVIHGVRGRLHPPVHLPAWPAGTVPHTRLVLIAEDMSAGTLEDLFTAVTGAPRIGVPDLAARTDNPLAPPGLRGSRS